ncbi:hypothetical protein [Oxalobacter formigenes]|nr:hypothetical protein [Oxalobacter formigenes]ARQ78901.1 hypothetical protein BRW84_09965 [Oxalobacter formigenes OXCC13]WAW05925.1 hypothetical protein NB639_00505 [Oxalobacter formigenes]
MIIVLWINLQALIPLFFNIFIDLRRNKVQINQKLAAFWAMSGENHGEKISGGNINGEKK